MKFNYTSLVSRNGTYVDSATQEKISKSRLLIAGCGIGSQVAEAAARIGFQNFILVDGDTVDLHNLNRQSFFNDQVGLHKVEALKQNILRINPLADVKIFAVNLGPSNVDQFVRMSDLVFDTIDFLDLKGIVCLHDVAHKLRKPLISSFSVGFGAAIICMPVGDSPHAMIRDIFELSKQGDIGQAKYVDKFMKLFEVLSPALDPTVLLAMKTVFQEIADGKVCPAPQVIAGAQSVASICITAACRLLSGQLSVTGPEMQILNLIDFLNQPGIQIVHKIKAAA